MGSREQSPITDAASSLQLQSRQSARGRLLGHGFVPGANKRSVLGLLAVLVGVGASATHEGLLVAIPLLVVGCYLLIRPLV